MNLFKKNDRKNSAQNSNKQNNPRQGNIMNASTEKKSIDFVKPENNRAESEVNPAKSEINPIKSEGNNSVQKDSGIAPKEEQALSGMKQ